MKKKLHNKKRSKKEVSKEARQKSVETSNCTDGNQKSIGTTEGVDETMIKHLQMTLSMIEERKVSRAEVLALIERMRQHSIATEQELPYADTDPDDKPG